jgi:hypothetical protein
MLTNFIHQKACTPVTTLSLLQSIYLIWPKPGSLGYLKTCEYFFVLYNLNIQCILKIACTFNTLCIYQNVIFVSTGVPEEDVKKLYVCPPDFARNGNSYYFFSTHMATWQDAHFECKDRYSELARLEKVWED